MDYESDDDFDLTIEPSSVDYLEKEIDLIDSNHKYEEVFKRNGATLLVNDQKDKTKTEKLCQNVGN